MPETEKLLYSLMEPKLGGYMQVILNTTFKIGQCKQQNCGCGTVGKIGISLITWTLLVSVKFAQIKVVGN